MQTASNLSKQTEPYALIVAGDKLAPRLRNNDLVRIDPGCTADPGQLVVAELSGNRVGIFEMNGDGDIADRCGCVLSAGTFRILGTARRISSAAIRPAPQPVHSEDRFDDLFCEPGEQICESIDPFAE